MVLGGDDDPFHPGLFRQLGNLAGVEFVGIELLGQGHVIGLRDMHLPLDPFADAVEGLPAPFAAEMGEESPVNEHAVISVTEERGAIRFFNPGQHLGVAPHLIHRLCGACNRRLLAEGQRTLGIHTLEILRCRAAAELGIVARLEGVDGRPHGLFVVHERQAGGPPAVELGGKVFDDIGMLRHDVGLLPIVGAEIEELPLRLTPALLADQRPARVSYRGHPEFAGVRIRKLIPASLMGEEVAARPVRERIL